MRYVTSLIGLTLALALLAAGCGAPKETKPQVQPIPITATEAKAGTLSATGVAAGQIDPALSLGVTAKIPGRVLAVYKEMGDKVKAGDRLVALEDRDAAAQAAQARAMVAQAEAQKAEAERQLARLTNLFSAGAVSKQQLEQVQTQVSLASAQVEAARAQLVLAELQLERTLITAPAAGVLASRGVEPGALVGAGTTVFTLVNIDTVVAKAGIPEGEINALKVGAPVQVAVTALGRELTGTVEAIGPAMDKQTRTYPIRVALPNQEGLLKGGMYAQVRYAVKEVAGVVVPVTAVVERSGETIVFVADGDKVRQQVVKVLVTAGDAVAVQGVKAGEKVAVAGQSRLYDGAPVTLTAKGATP